MMQVAFYAPLKSPDHCVASGDRQMARLLMSALECAGHDVVLMSHLRTYLKQTGDDAEAMLRAQADQERHKILGQIAAGERPKPDIWFSYHPYYKSPDWLGPAISTTLGIPYVTAEASYAAKRERGPWAQAQQDVRDGLRQAALNFYMTTRDRAGLVQAIGNDHSLAHLSPFIDFADIEPVFEERRIAQHTPVRLLSVAMMRDDVKLASYRFLAEALSELPFESWHLTIVGDGDARGKVEGAFTQIPAQNINWLGALDRHELNEQYAHADLYVWPGIGEAYGMAYLEAQAHGVPVVSQNTGGVSSVVKDQVSGLLTPAGDIEAYRKALAALIGNADLRVKLRATAFEYVRINHGIDAAARSLDASLDRVQTRHIHGN